MSLGNNSVGWSVLGPVTHSGKVLDGNFGQSEWGVEMAEILMNRCRDIKSPYGGVLGDLFDRTPKSTICKYMIEEKLFDTWYYGRTCLMGDGEFLTFHARELQGKLAFNVSLTHSLSSITLWSLDDTFSPISPLKHVIRSDSKQV